MCLELIFFKVLIAINNEINNPKNEYTGSDIKSDCLLAIPPAIAFAAAIHFKGISKDIGFLILSISFGIGATVFWLVMKYRNK